MSSTDRDQHATKMRKLWRAASPSSQPHLPTTQTPEEILMEVKQRSAKFERALVMRDVREGLAGLLVTAVGIGTATMVPGPWPKLGAAAMVACVVVVLWILRRSHRAEGNAPASSLADQIRGEIAKVKKQEALLGSVALWYVAPLALGATVWVVSLLPATELPAALLAGMAVAMIAASATLFAAVGWAVVALNRRAIDRELVPYREELERTLQELIV